MKTIALPCATASEQYFVRPRYIRYLEKAAAMCEMDILPVLLPPTENPQTIRTYAEQYDGYLFSGGFDVEPSRYGEEKNEHCGNIEPERDAFELALLKELIDRDRPVFGVCRGCQIMNVALGGTLWQDQAAMLPLEKPHAVKNADDKPVHPVTVSGFLSELTQTDRIQTNSYHHQSVKKAGNGLHICAYAADGVAEAIAHTSLSYYRAVQWHPEMDPDDISFMIIKDFLRKL
ncbi:MAG: gamma-glutamyl-gamma-aminobutyrate hydrolase family protein [Clostridia bacterium]|nr:gamma-glutamyl-gamma-aminobutyrate hydrolase family protein [Clostridia bacterium]